ncbi:MAG: glycosyltransferase family 9 protein [Vicingaceae bacterium]
MTNKFSKLIFIDSLFTPVYYLASGTLPLLFSPNKKKEKVIAIKFFGMGSLVRMANTLKQSDFSYSNLELITLDKNKNVADLLEIKAHYIRTNNPFSLFWDLFKVIIQVWQMKKIVIVDLERTSKLSGILRLICSIGASCSSFTLKNENVEKNNQRFISLKAKTMSQAINELFDLKKLPEKVVFNETVENGKIVININAGDYLRQRKYAIEHFIEVISSLSESDNSLEFILIGSKKEKSYTQQLTNRLDELKINYTNTTGSLSLKELAQLLQNSQLLITNDSGPLHLAYYFNVQTVAIWGPTSPYLVGYPDSCRMKNVSLEKECSPCFIHPKSKVAAACNGRIDCLTNLNPQKVVNVVMELIQDKNKSLHNVG